MSIIFFLRQFGLAYCGLSIYSKEQNLYTQRDNHFHSVNVIKSIFKLNLHWLPHWLLHCGGIGVVVAAVAIWETTTIICCLQTHENSQYLVANMFKVANSLYYKPLLFFLLSSLSLFQVKKGIYADLLLTTYELFISFVVELFTLCHTHKLSSLNRLV